MWPRFGVKVGNSTLCIAYSKPDGSPVVIANKQGDRTSQACLLWNGADETECGLTARQKMATRPKQAVANSFQMLLPPEELSDDKIYAALGEIPSEFNKDTHTFSLKCVMIQDSGDSTETLHEMSAFDVHVQLLRAELELARQYYNESSQKPSVVLSIPTYYTARARSLLAQCAEQAGFHVAQIISEPTAAVLAYGIGEDDSEMASDEKYVLTIKSGGLFSHFALYCISNGLYTQLAAYGPFPIGGRHYTEALVQFICDEFQRKYKLDPHESRRSIAKIRTAASNSKHILTTLSSTQIYIDSLMDGVDFNSLMSRARFESLIQPVISNFMQTLNECVEKALQEHESVKQIDEIVLLGATMQIPKLQAVIASRFPEAKLNTSVSPDEVVAVGCARQATFLVDPDGQELSATEKCTFADENLHIWHGDDDSKAALIVEKGSLLPLVTRLEVWKQESAVDAEVFHLRAGEKVNKIVLEGSVANDSNMFRLEAEVDCGAQEDAPVPQIRLRCM